MKDDLSSLTLLDILRGYSVLKFKNKKYYFRHFTIGEMLEVDEFEKIEFDKAVKSGIKTESQLIDAAIKINSWTNEKEEKIKSLKWTINHSVKALKGISDVNQRKSFSAQIDKQREDLEKIVEGRKKISSYSAEHLADQKKFIKMMELSLFYDKGFKKSAKKMAETRLGTLVFSKFAQFSNKETLLKAAYFTYFFDVFVAQHRNPLVLFEGNLLNLTIFQKNLLSYANSLLNKMKNIEMPDEISGDPIKIFDYEEPKDRDKKVSHGLDDLKMKMKARGGELKPEDLLT